MPTGAGAAPSRAADGSWHARRVGWVRSTGRPRPQQSCLDSRAACRRALEESPGSDCAAMSILADRDPPGPI